MSKLSDMLIAHEGLELKPYHDSRGRLTIGVGRCLDEVGISKSEALLLLDHDILRATQEAQTYHWFWELNEPRQDVVISMIFNLGADGFYKFSRLISALERSAYPAASLEMLNSDWAKEVGSRARDLASIMSSGEYP